MTAELKAVERPASTEMSTQADIVETFYFRRVEGEAPIEMKVWPHRADWTTINIIDDLMADAANVHAKLNKLRRKRDLFDPDDYASESALEEARVEQERIARQISELEKTPKPLEIACDELFLKVIKQWPLTWEGELIPLTREGVMKLSNITLTRLREQLTSFLSPEERKKKKN